MIFIDLYVEHMHISMSLTPQTQSITCKNYFCLHCILKSYLFLSIIPLEKQKYAVFYCCEYFMPQRFGPNGKRWGQSHIRGKKPQWNQIFVNKKQTNKKTPEKQVAVRQVGALLTAQALSEEDMKHKGLATYLEEAAARAIQGPFL